MLIDIVCTCGLPIGDVAVIFRAMRRKRYEEELRKRGAEVVAAAQIPIDPTMHLDMSDDYARLGITEDCCKIGLNAAMDFRDYY